MRLLSLNAGLVRRVFGLVEPTPEVEARLAVLPEKLLEHRADLVVLQELYEKPHVQRVAAALAPAYPFAYASAGASRLRLGAGLATWSKCPIDGSFHAFSTNTLDERLLAPKGFLRVRLVASDPLTLFVMHTTAGGIFRHPEAADIESIREEQIRQVLEAAAQTPEPVVIVGDLNAGPGASERNYRLLAEAGYRDIYAMFHRGSEDVTWDPRNPLNAAGPHRACPPQRIDHAFVRAMDVESGLLCPRGCEIVLREPVVRAVDGSLVTISDHYGLLLDLTSRTTVS